MRRQGYYWTQTYVNQHPTAPLKQGRAMRDDETTGTSVTFWPDPKIFETTIYDFETLRSRFQQMAFLNKGLKITLTDMRETEVNQHPTAPLKQGRAMRDDETTGTSVTFWPDPKIFETTIYDFETLRSRFQQMEFLNMGLKITLTDMRETEVQGDEVTGDGDDMRETEVQGDEVTGDGDNAVEELHQTVTYQYANGIKDYGDYMVKLRKATPIEPDVIDLESEDLQIGISAEIARQWTTAYSESVHTFANTISRTEGVAKEEGDRESLTSMVIRYSG